MGFRIELTAGCSIALRSRQRTGAAVILDPRRTAVPGRRQARRGGGGANRPQADGPCGRRVAAGRNGRGRRRGAGKAGSTGTRPPTSCPRKRPSCNPRTSAAARRQPLHAEHAHRPHRRDALRPLFDRLGPSARARSRSRSQDPRSGDGFGRLPGRSLPPACQKLVDAWHDACGPPCHSARRGRAAARPAPGRPALPLRGGQERDGGGSGPPVSVAGDVSRRTTSSRSSITRCCMATR